MDEGQNLCPPKSPTGHIIALGLCVALVAVNVIPSTLWPTEGARCLRVVALGYQGKKKTLFKG